MLINDRNALELDVEPELELNFYFFFSYRISKKHFELN